MAREAAATDAQQLERAALVHGWICNGGDGMDGHYWGCVYRLPGTPAYASVAYATNGTMLWGGWP